MSASELLERIPPEPEIRKELGEKLREVSALKELLRIARKRGERQAKGGER